MTDVIDTDTAPAAVGAYSQATTDGNPVFTAGQIPLRPDGGLLNGPIAERTEQALENVSEIPAAAGASMDDVLRVTVFPADIADITDFEAMNEGYASHFEGAPPARSAVAVGVLPKGAGVEIEAVASVAGD
jgi:reactive intermediate/imine deaminase